jgi:hypothetical protein
MNKRPHRLTDSNRILLALFLTGLYGWVGREVGSAGAYYGSRWSDKPIDNLYDTIATRALRASLEGMTTGAIVAAIAGIAAVAMSYRRFGLWSSAIGFLVAIAAGVITGFCSGHF